MPIPKIIHQTYKSKSLPFVSRWYISRFRKNNPEFAYEFYDDERVESFLESEYDSAFLNLYKKIKIGAAKADFFRYAVLYKKGGVYLDIDSNIKGKLDDIIMPDDVAVLSKEKNLSVYVQWALIYDKQHPFLKKTIDMVCENIRTNRYPHDVHSMTGPTVYANAVSRSLGEDPTIPYRLVGVDYDHHFQFKYPLNKFLYKKEEHWKTMQLTSTVLHSQ